MASKEEGAEHRTATALMDAAERLLITRGQAGVSTRRVAEEAGQPHGLVRYHFGSLEGLMLRTLERATARITDRQRALYGGNETFLRKWRTAMGLIDEDLEEGFPKIVAELFAKAWNEPVYREGLTRTMNDFTDLLTDAVTDAASEYRHELPAQDARALATLIRTFQLGILIERLAGIDIGHAELLAAIDRRLADEQKEDEARPTA
ncbi:TetR/AcrR family transcriptional regulator [Streptomyces sp. HK10]|uniref:TetR/AcrR family transcriptional regulator n=1 Tax=Streptomyces sp. HK10 TaxID=3373255 RepID=UPI003747BA96